MLFLKNDFKEELFVECLQGEDIPYDLSAYVLIDYKVKAFCNLEKILLIVNELYLELIKAGTNEKLLNVFAQIIERLNNLNHFQLSETEMCANGKNLIDILMGKFDNFKYKKLSEFDINTNIEFIKPIKLSKEQFENISEEKCEGYYYYPNYLEKIDKLRLNKEEVDLEFNLVSKNHERKILSFIKDEKEAKIKEYKDILERIGTLSKDKEFIEGYYWIEYSSSGMYIDIICIINKLLLRLMYLLNSTSFRENNLFIFDEIEVSNSLMNLEEEIKWIKKIFMNQAKISI